MRELDEDVVLLAIGELRGEMKGMNDRIDTMNMGLGREIGEIKAALKEEGRACQTCKDVLVSRIDTKAKEQDGKIAEVAGQVQTIRDQHAGEKAITSFLDTNIGRIVSVIGIISGIIALVAIALPWIARVA